MTSAAGLRVSPYQAEAICGRENNGMSPPMFNPLEKTTIVVARSIRFGKETAPLPNMMAFDSTSREVLYGEAIADELLRSKP